MNKSKPIIVLGVHRSGTTLLSSLLHKSGVWMGAKQNHNKESVLFYKINKQLLIKEKENGYFFSNTVEKLNEQDFLKKSKEFAIENINEKFNIDFLGIIGFFKKSIYNDFKWGFKDPRNIIFLKMWRSIYPKAKFIIIYRNPKDVATSIYYFERKRYEGKVKYGNRPDLKFNMGVDKCFQVWKSMTELLLEAETDLGDSVYSVRYEDLKSKDKLSELTKFVNVDYKNSLFDMINYNRSNYKTPEHMEILEGLISSDKISKELGY